MPFAIESRLCPIFSAAKLAAAAPEQLQPSAIVAPDGGKPPSREFDGVKCQGTGCAWFQTISDENGKAIDGACAVGMVNVSLGNLARIAGALANLLANAVSPPTPGSQGQAPETPKA